MSKNRTEVFIEFLGADTSVPKVRHTMCVVICFIAPVVMGLGVWWWLPDHGWPLLCQIAAPLFGFGASVLWLLWPWFRTDIETAHRVMVVTSREIDHDGEPISEEPSEIKVTPIGSILDKAEKGSYRYVGGALALSWLLTLIPIVQAARDPAPPPKMSRSYREAFRSSRRLFISIARSLAIFPEIKSHRGSARQLSESSPPKLMRLSVESSRRGNL